MIACYHTIRTGGREARNAFEVIPAIDVLEGRVVRLSQGRREAVTIEGGDPVELARRFRDEGARRLHLVDLDGAFSGEPTLGLVELVASAGGLPVQVGGGYRSLDAIDAALGAGADRVMVGTAALSPRSSSERHHVSVRHSSSRSTSAMARSPSRAGREAPGRPPLHSPPRVRGPGSGGCWSRAPSATGRWRGPISRCWPRYSRQGCP